MSKKNILQYAVGIILALAVFFAGAFSQDLFQETELLEIYGTLSNCFLFPGALLGGIGALTWIAGEGTFDMLSYGFKMVFQRFIHPKDEPESFYEYKVRKGEEQKDWLKHYFIIGLVCLGASVVFALLYMAND